MDSQCLSDDNLRGQALLGELEVSLLNLRERWPQRWPGLHLVFQRCLSQLQLSPTPASSRLQAVAACAQAVGAWLERDGTQRRREGREPRYHNRLHMADALVCLTQLLKAQRLCEARRSTRSERHEWLGLLAVLSHDLLHDGSVNQYPAQLESCSAQALTPLMQRHGMHAQDQQIVRHLILKTDPLCVRQTHAQVADRRFTVRDEDCLAVLVEEADVLASTLAVTAADLTRSLHEEWLRSSPAMAANLLTPLGRWRFLEFGALFSSPASHLLGVPQARQAEMQTLQQAGAHRLLSVPETPSRSAA
jgi:hypothetical protein